jgi:hypothetical protein
MNTKRRRLTADIVNPSRPLHQEDVICEEYDIECLKHQKDMPTFQYIGGVIGGDDGSDELWWYDSHACSGCDPAKKICRSATVALENKLASGGDFS